MGGALLEIIGAGIPTYDTVTVGGIRSQLVSVNHTSNQYFYRIPSYSFIINPIFINSTESARIQPVKQISDLSVSRTAMFDKDITTEYASSGSMCYLGYILPGTYLFTYFRFFIPYTVAPAAYNGAKLQATKSNNVSTAIWTDLLSFNGNIKNGWNTFMLPLGETAYNMVRFLHDLTSINLNQTSNCRLGEFEVYGYILGDPSPTAVGLNLMQPPVFLNFTD